MPFTEEQYKRRKEITGGCGTGEICSVCNFEIVVDKNIEVPFCCCGYRQWQRNGKAVA